MFVLLYLDDVVCANNAGYMAILSHAEYSGYMAILPHSEYSGNMAILLHSEYSGYMAILPGPNRLSISSRDE